MFLEGIQTDFKLLNSSKSIPGLLGDKLYSRLFMCTVLDNVSTCII